MIIADEYLIQKIIKFQWELFDRPVTDNYFSIYIKYENADDYSINQFVRFVIWGESSPCCSTTTSDVIG